jgi:hypothetical protein
MRKDNGDPNWSYWEDIKANKEFSFHFSHGGRILMTSDNKEEILDAAKKLYGGDWLVDEETAELILLEHNAGVTV